MDPGQAKQEACTRAAVGLRQAAGTGKQESFRVVTEDSGRLVFVDQADKGIQEGCFTFDGIFNLDTGQVRRALASTPGGLAQASHRVRPEPRDCPGSQTQQQGKAAQYAPAQTRGPEITGHPSRLLRGQAGPGVGSWKHPAQPVNGLRLRMDEVFSELLRPLLATVPLGYSVSLLLWEATCAGTQPQPQGPGLHHSIVQQVIEATFQQPEPPGGSGEPLRTVSFVQLCADGSAKDLLSPRTQALHVLDVPPLGLVVEEASEKIVRSSAAAATIYVQGLEANPALPRGGLQQPPAEQPAAGGASLFTLTVQQRVEGCRCRRSAVRILEFPRGAGPCAEPLSPLRRALAPGELPADAGLLPWVLKRTLEGNNLTCLLLCLTLPGASGEEILAALSLAEQVRGLAKEVSPTHWDPGSAAQRQRAAIRELRAQLLSSSRGAAQEGAIGRLRRALRELQVLKSQSWEKKEEPPAGARSRRPEAQGPGPLPLGGAAGPTDFPRQRESPDGGDPKPGGDAQGARPRRADEAALSSPGGAERLSASPGAATGRSPWPGGAQEPACATGAAGSGAGPALEQRFARAEARRRRLQEQHQRLVQQELLRLEEELAATRELPPAQRAALKEKAALALQLEALRRERAEAEKDLQDLRRQHRREAEAHKRHVLQVFRAYRGLAEEQTEQLDRRYRKLLQEALQDAITLSAQNQQLQAQRQARCTESTTQTEPHA
ncbi:uncharacterized protein LOC142021366 [Carettochelys insculpta]|uniref:uncharacterized protein LOC142021366 n=1 Tax=Carettochelys insculpta TaxID=44489 RepID=UPI003EB916EF